MESTIVCWGYTGVGISSTTSTATSSSSPSTTSLATTSCRPYKPHKSHRPHKPCTGLPGEGVAFILLALIWEATCRWLSKKLNRNGNYYMISGSRSERREEWQIKHDFGSGSGMEKRLQAKRICRICGLWLLGLVGRESRGFRYNPRDYEGFRKLGVPCWGDFFLRIRIQLGSTFGSLWKPSYTNYCKGTRLPIPNQAEASWFMSHSTRTDRP